MITRNSNVSRDEGAMLLGSMYLQGDGVAKDARLALQCLRRTILGRKPAVGPPQASV